MLRGCGTGRDSPSVIAIAIKQIEGLNGYRGLQGYT